MHGKNGLVWSTEPKEPASSMKKISQERHAYRQDVLKIPCKQFFCPALQNLTEYYANNKTGIIASSLGNEAMESFEMVLFASGFVENAMHSMNEDTTGYTEMKAQMKGMADGFFKGVNLTIDKRTMPGILEIYFDSADTAYFPETFKTIHKRFHGDVTAYVDWLYKKSLFADHNRLNRVIDNFSARLSKRLIADPAFRFYQDFSNVFHPYYLIV